MFKLILSGIVLFLSVSGVAAQTTPAESPKTLLLEIGKSRPDTNRISLELKLGSYYLFKPGEYKNDLDSAINFFNQAAQLSNKLHEIDWKYRTLALIGNYYVEAGDLKRCSECFMQVISYYHQKGNLDKEAACWQWLGDLYRNNQKNDHMEERIKCYQHARSLYLQNHDPLSAAMELESIADVQIVNKQFDLAENNLQKALIQYQASGYKKRQYAYDLLYNIELRRGNYYLAMAYSSEAIKAMKASGDTALSGHFYYEMARGNWEVKKFKEALGWIRKTLVVDKGKKAFFENCLLIQILLTLNRTEQAHMALNELLREKSRFIWGDTVSLYRTFAFYYDKINKSDLAIRYYKKILELDLKQHYSEEYYLSWMLICDNAIAEIYLKTNQAKKAETYLNNAALTIKNPKAIMDPNNLVAYFHNLYNYEMATGNYYAAAKSLEKGVRIKDSLFTADKDKQIAELNIRYQTAQNEQSIQYLHSQSAVQQTRLEKISLQKNITIGGIILVSAFAGLFYRQYKQKQRANLAVTQQNEIITQKNEMLQHLLTSKEWLLKEVHHRVKNNLHTVICLLESQAAYLENDALKAVENSQHRIYAMSLIHQKLYQSEDIKTVDMSVYLPEFVRYLNESFGTTNQIRFELDIAPLKLGVSYAVPLSLIINEAVTNAIKYAFPGEKKGTVYIRLHEVDQYVKLVIADNGIGIDTDKVNRPSASLGLKLLRGLSEDIKADVSIENCNGTEITLVFKMDELMFPVMT